MENEQKREYRYLDSEADRQMLCEDIRRVRRDLLKWVEAVPPEKWYEPRYHGWSLAAMLGHLQLMDNLTLRLIQLGLMGVRIPISEDMVNSFNTAMAGVFKKRVVETTLRGLEKNEQRLTDFVMQVPMDRFSRLVYHPMLKAYLTVEQAMQEFFYYHWEGHLQTIRQVEDVFYEPPTRSSEV